MEIKAGDIVVLKSGGPLMTVKSCGGGRAYCNWFDGTELKKSDFSIPQLNITEKPEV